MIKTQSEVSIENRNDKKRPNGYYRGEKSKNWNNDSLDKLNSILERREVSAHLKIDEY